MTQKPALAGVIGNPITHTKSPDVHGHWLKTLRISGQYVALHAEAEDLEGILHLLPKLGFRGLNVTIPHKLAVLDFATNVSDTAREIGAANTLVFQENGQIFADNTDAYGFIANLRDSGPLPTDRPAALIGAGGAANAVIHGLLSEGVSEVRVMNRTAARAEALAKQFGARVRVVAWRDMSSLLDGAGLVVNGTSLGMKGQPDFDLDLSRMAAGVLASDLVYTPLNTPFLQAAAAQGARCVDGLGMLLHQAVPGFEAWFGQRPEVTEALRKGVLG